MLLIHYLKIETVLKIELLIIQLVNLFHILHVYVVPDASETGSQISYNVIYSILRG